jgi:hypothetical protein
METQNDEKELYEAILKRIEILDYTEYSIAVFGWTRFYSKELKEAGGTYNKYLKHPVYGKVMPGWIFRKKQREQIRQILKLP